MRQILASSPFSNFSDDVQWSRQIGITGFAKILNLYRFILLLESNAVQLRMTGVTLAALAARVTPCHSPKLYPASIFNHFFRPPAAHSDDATLRLRRSQSPVRTLVVASLSAPAHPYIKINVFWKRGTTTRHKTHSIGLEVYYPWHPWFGLKVTTNRPFTRRGVARVYATLEHEGRPQQLERVTNFKRVSPLRSLTSR